MKREWFKIVAATKAELKSMDVTSASDVTVIEIMDEIGLYGVSAKDFLQKLAAVKTPKVLVKLNSPGGSVMDGLAIYNALRAHAAEIFTKVIGYAASMASIILLAADAPENVLMSENSYGMIHRPTMGGVNADELKSMLSDMEVWFENLVPEVESDIALLKSTEEMFARMYSAASNWDLETARAKMNATTWLTAQEMVDAGFMSADNITEPVAMAATADTEDRLRFLGYGNIPKDFIKHLNNGGESDETPTGNDVDKILSYMKKKFSPTAMTASLLKMLKEKGFSITAPKDKKDEDIKADFTNVMDMLGKEFIGGPEVKMVKVKDATGKIVEMELAEDKPVKKVKVKNAQGKIVEMESAEEEVTEEEEENEEEGAEEEGSEEEKETPTEKAMKKMLAPLMKDQKLLKDTLTKLTNRKAGGAAHLGEDEPGEVTAMDIISGKVKKGKNKGGFGASKMDETLVKAGNVAVKRLKDRQ